MMVLSLFYITFKIMVNQSLSDYFNSSLGANSFNKYMNLRKLAAYNKKYGAKALKRSLKTIIPFNNYNVDNYINKAFNLENI